MTAPIIKGACHGRNTRARTPWNKGKLIRQKSPLKLKEIWAIRIRLQLSDKARDLALHNLRCWVA
jgi:hypothetical protein